ncbi:hypothetical protein AALP_AA8G064100 [Arabis alpina]|uniref:Leucine-rich repeat-containing N-terminal plant-type domain-containing protein n=1 Tax=Arabis alpina TaxID=50452 RepID=A0A087G5D5_ARAAL|nr:hypothetical protein AALP_AA8G064100 [Arabis alpina]
MDKTMTLLLFLFTLLFTTSISKDHCNKDDKKTVLKIKKSLNSHVPWDPLIECGGAGDIKDHIISLIIYGSPISGQIPPEVGDLPYLETLIFGNLSKLTGPIQPTIAKLKKLRTLRLTLTKLTGPVPDFLSQLKNLVEIDLSHNDLSGSIPSSLSMLPNIFNFILSYNKLTGTVPDLYLSHNQLSGSIPKSLGKLDFNRIDFSWNKLEGDASILFGANKTTGYIDLSRNMFQFDLSKVKIPKTLGILELNHNGITGNIPVQWTEAPLQFFNVSYNRLCGCIPSGGKLQTFDTSSYFHNKCLCGAPLKSCK